MLPRKPFLMLALALCLLMLAPAPPAVAEPASPSGDSMNFVPADAAIYGSMRRNREQYDALVQSNAWATLQAIPVVQMGQTLLKMQMQQEGVREVLAFFEAEENQPLKELLLDSVSDEIFYYGGPEWNGLADLMMQLASLNRFAHLLGVIADDPEQAANQLWAEMVTAHLDQIVVPDLVVGLRIRDREGAKQQLARLEGVLQEQLADKDEWKGRLQRTTIQGEPFLTLAFDSDLLPEEDAIEEIGELPNGDKIVAHLKALKGKLCIGLYGDYLLISFGDSTEHLEQLGKVPAIATRPEFRRLMPHLEQRVTGLGYVSAGFARAADQTRHNGTSLEKVTTKLLPQVDLPEEKKQKLLADVTALIQQAEGTIGKPGASVAVGYLTERGYEGFQYDWSTNPRLETGKPLTILEHVGGAPLVATALRTRPVPGEYATFRRLLALVFEYSEKFALPQMDEPTRKMYEAVKEDFLPLVARLDTTTAEQLLPALAEGQTAFVLDADLTSKQWIAHLPETAQRLPMVHPALVFGVSDAQQLARAMGEYRAILNEALTLASQYSPELSFRLPPPEAEKLEQGTLYQYAFPGEAGIDAQLAPCAGLSDEVAVLAMAPAHVKQLLRPTPLHQEGPLAQLDRPLARATYVDFAGMVDAVTPWIDLLVRYASQEEPASLLREQHVVDRPAEPGRGLGDPRQDSPAVKAILEQVHQALRVLATVRTYSSATYAEDGAVVTHSELHLLDLK